MTITELRLSSDTEGYIKLGLKTPLISNLVDGGVYEWDSLAEIAVAWSGGEFSEYPVPNVVDGNYFLETRKVINGEGIRDTDFLMNETPLSNSGECNLKVKEDYLFGGNHNSCQVDVYLSAEDIGYLDESTFKFEPDVVRITLVKKQDSSDIPSRSEDLFVLLDDE
jgi:hypothetical protein